MVYRVSINAKLGKAMLNAGALNFDLQVHRSVYSEKAKQHSLSKFKTTPGRGVLGLVSTPVSLPRTAKVHRGR